MTDDRALIRNLMDAAEADGPPIGLSVDAIARKGRRGRTSRRILGGGSVALASVGLIAGVSLSGHNNNGSSTVTQPAAAPTDKASAAANLREKLRASLATQLSGQFSDGVVTYGPGLLAQVLYSDTSGATSFAVSYGYKATDATLSICKGSASADEHCSSAQTSHGTATIFTSPDNSTTPHREAVLLLPDGSSLTVQERGGRLDPSATPPAPLVDVPARLPLDDNGLAKLLDSLAS